MKQVFKMIRLQSNFSKFNRVTQTWVFTCYMANYIHSDDYLIFFCAISHFDYSCEQSYSQRRLPWVFISFLTFRRQLVGYDSHLQRTLCFKAICYCDTDPNLEPKRLGSLSLPCHFTAKWPWTMLALLSPLGQELDPAHHFINIEHCTHFITTNFVYTCQKRFSFKFTFPASNCLPLTTALITIIIQSDTASTW